MGGIKNRLSQQYMLLHELIRSPGDMGTVCPSSPALSAAMAEAISPSLLGPDGLVVELGAGTGPVTEALLAHGVPRDRLLVIEKSEPLVDCLNKKFPGVDVRCGGAEELESMAPEGKIRAIVSSLPFRSLPQEVSVSIMNVVERALSPGGLYVQFTYALVGEMPYVPKTFRKIRVRFVLYNIPPAKVAVFRKPRETDTLTGL